MIPNKELAHILFYSQRPNVITKVNDKINMDNTIAGSMNDSINMDNTIAGSMDDKINMDNTI